jgi:hypothetical protein
MSVAGSWKLTMDTPFGVQTPLLVIKQEGGAYSGTLAGESGEAALEEIKVEEANLGFRAEISTPMGNVPVSFRARIEGDALSGTYKTLMGVTEFSGVRE